MAITSQIITSVIKDVEKLDPSYTVGGNVKMVHFSEMGKLFKRLTVD